MTPENRIGDWMSGDWIVPKGDGWVVLGGFDGRQLIANTGGYTDNMRDLGDEQRANARLIAKSPQLAEAALRMYRRLRAMDMDDPEAREALEAAGVKI